MLISLAGIPYRPLTFNLLRHWRGILLVFANSLNGIIFKVVLLAFPPGVQILFNLRLFA